MHEVARNGASVRRMGLLTHEAARNGASVRRRILFTHEAASNDHLVRRMGLFTHEATRNDHPVRRMGLFTHETGGAGGRRSRLTIPTEMRVRHTGLCKSGVCGRQTRPWPVKQTES